MSSSLFGISKQPISVGEVTNHLASLFVTEPQLTAKELETRLFSGVEIDKSFDESLVERLWHNRYVVAKCAALLSRAKVDLFFRSPLDCWLTHERLEQILRLSFRSSFRGCYLC